MRISCTITFIDGEKVEVTEDNFIINGWVVSEEGKKSKEYYLSNEYLTPGDHYDFETSNRVVGISGFIGSVDYFSIGRDTEILKLYKSSSVKSIDNVHEKPVEPVKLLSRKQIGL